jgi:hypothetical protein
MLNPSRYMRSADFQGKEPTLTIEDVRLETFEEDDGDKKVKGIVTFKEPNKITGEPLRWVMNVTNATSLAQMFGKDTAAWANKRVTLYAAPYKGDTAIRVRGSPDLPKDLRFMLKLARKKAVEIVLTKTGGAPVPMPEEASSNG